MNEERVEWVSRDRIRIVGRAEQIVVGKAINHWPLVGDFVTLDETEERVEEVVSRRNVLRRADPGQGDQELAANVDVLLLVCGADRPIKAGRIAREAALAWECGAEPIVVITKSDLAADISGLMTTVVQQNPGIDVIATTTSDSTTAEMLLDVIGDRTAVLIGESGAGKSSLTNALAGRDVAAVDGVREGDQKGRHTTTARSLLAIGDGGTIIDTPGIRAVGLPSGVDVDELMFADIVALEGGCKFRDCRHLDEPGCNVRTAAEAGALPAQRLDLWHELRREAESAQRRANVHEQRRYERSFSRIVDEAQRIKRGDQPR